MPIHQIILLFEGGSYETELLRPYENLPNLNEERNQSGIDRNGDELQLMKTMIIM